MDSTNAASTNNFVTDRETYRNYKNNNNKIKIEINKDLEEANPLSDSSLAFLVTFEFRNVLEERGKPE